MSVSNYTELRSHIGHEIECVFYNAGHEYEQDPVNVSLECVTCGEVLMDFDQPKED